MKLLRSLFVAVVGACALAPVAVAASSPPPIGDGCLVGRWVETRQSAHFGWNGALVAVSGLRGMMVTFSADGFETDDMSHAQHLIGDDQGHQLQVVVSGNAQFHVHADGAVLTQSALVDNVGVSYIYDGQPIQGGAPFPPVAYTYRCTPTALHREASSRGVSPFAPVVDDLVRMPVVGASGSLVSTVSSSLATPASVVAAPVTLLMSAVIALAAVLLITFPSQLFNRTYEENHEVIRYFWERRFPWLLRRRMRILSGRRRAFVDGLGYGAVVACGGVLAALLDPLVGLNLRSLALFSGAVLALIAGSLVGFVASATYRGARHLGGPWHLHALPSGLLVATACVLVSRLTNFQPGYLYGLIGGVVFAHRLTSRQEGHTVAITSLVTLAVALGAWLAWVPASAQAVAHPQSFAWALASNFLAAVFVSGMVGLLIGLVPLRFLPGDKLATWHRGVWGAVFGLAALAVVGVMLRPQRAGTHVTTAPFLTTAALFVGFGAASVAFWAYFKMRRGPMPGSEAATASASDK